MVLAEFLTCFVGDLCGGEPKSRIGGPPLLVGGIINQFGLLDRQYVCSRESKVSNHKIGRGVRQVKACPYQNHIIQRRDNCQSI